MIFFSFHAVVERRASRLLEQKASLCFYFDVEKSAALIIH